MGIIDNIINIMNKKGITAYKIEKDLGIRQQTFSNWKNGTQAPVERINDLINYLGVTPNEVYGYEQGKDLLNDPQKEMISIMEGMNERDQWKAVGIIENYSQNIKSGDEAKSDESSISKIS